MKIGFIHSGSAFMPEIQAYQEYFGDKGIESRVYKTGNQLGDEQIAWHFCGLSMCSSRKKKIVVHEYASLSTPPFARQKNYLKRYLNTKPNLRIFNNEFVRRELKFSDGVPSLIRPAGIGPSLFEIQELPKPEFEFVYLGATDMSRRLGLLLEKFLQNFPTEKLLIIGTLPQGLLKHERITITGGIPYNQVPQWLRKAKFGLNYIPDIYPYNKQASLKLLEYCAVGLSIITTNYTWVNEFESSRNARFFKLNLFLENFNPQEIGAFTFSTPSVLDLTWNNAIEGSGILHHPVFSSI